ncbi:MAG: CotH kinase family protein [Crocinitomicaceae bacterium]
MLTNILNITPLKWCIPLLTLLFASFSYGQIDHWETAVYEYNTWSYLVPDSPVDEAWNTLDFDAGDWATGPGGFGYGDGDDNTVVPPGTVSMYQRIEFDVTDKSVIAAAALTIDYDDAFVAYLNGVEITRELMTGEGQPDYNQYAAGLHEATIYDGVYPAQYGITAAFLEEHLNEGMNVLCVQSHNESWTSSDMTSRVYFSFGITDASSDYGPTPGWFVPPVVLTESNLPIVVLETGGASIVDDPKIEAIMGIINNEDGMNSISDEFNDFYGHIGIEIRGSSSGTFPKKSFGLETRGPDSTNYNVSIFDWPVDNDWILYAPYSDKSLIRNVLTYKLGNEMGEYAPRTQLVELVINGQYQGVYVFMERIKQNPGRVAVDELEYDETEGNDLTGGYVIKIDKTTGGGIIAWTSPFLQAPPAWGPVHYQLHDPEIEEINPIQLDYIESYVTAFETALDGPDFDDPEEGYLPYIDLKSFIDFMIVNEISKNVDGYRISTFLHKHRLSEGGKLTAGPLWDFNLAWGNANYCQGGWTSGWEIYFNDVCGGGGALNNPFWWNRFVEDENYTHALNCRWQELRMSTLHTDSILAFIDEMEVLLEEPAERNFQRWQILGTYVWPNNFVGDTYAQEMDYLREWAIARLEWMDDNMFGSCEDLAVGEENSLELTLFPNPTNEKFYLQFNRPVANINVQVTSQTGQILINENVSYESIPQIDVSDLAEGFYLVKIYEDGELKATKKLLRN